MIPATLVPAKSHREPQGLKALHNVDRITFTPSEAKPGETLYVKIPILGENIVLVPGSLALVADLTLSGGHANNRVVDNVGRCLVSRRVLKIGAETIEDIERPDLLQTYSDLYLPTIERDARVGQGIQTENTNKLRSNAGDKGTSDTGENLLLAVYGSKYRIPLDVDILTQHGALYPFALRNAISLELTLSPATDVVVGSDTTKIGTYKLSNIQLEYEVVESEIIAKQAKDEYVSGAVFLFRHAVHFKTVPINKASDTLISQQVDVPRLSFTGLLLLFVAQHAHGTRNSEAFDYPGITKVEIDINGRPNRIFPGGMLPSDFWEAANGWFGAGKTSMTPIKFYNNKFAILVDCRTVNDPVVHGNGLNQTGSGKNLQIRIHRTGGSGIVNMHIFVLADAQITILNGALENVSY